MKNNWLRILFMVSCKNFLVKVLVLIVLSSSFVATSFASEMSTTITFVPIAGGTNVQIKILHPTSLDCEWESLDLDEEYGFCDTSGITWTLQNTSYLEALQLDKNKFQWRQVYFVGGTSIVTPWQIIGELNRGIPMNLFLYDDVARFYPSGEMQIEFKGLDLTYSVRGSLPRIKLLGQTKSELIAEEKVRAKKALEESRNWEFGRYNDGIDSFIYVDQDSDERESSVLRIYCQKKRLGAWISVDYADSRGWKGSAQIRFDSKPVKKLSYTLGRQFDSIYIDSPKAFVSEFLRSKRVLIKIGTVDGSELSTFYLGNLKAYKKQFSAKGCSLG
jgi:hypothetical protein